MSALRGTVDEWIKREDGCYMRIDHPEDGVVSIFEAKTTFEEVFEKWANPPPPPPTLEERLAALEREVAELKNGRESLQSGTGLSSVEVPTEPS